MTNVLNEAVVTTDESKKLELLYKVKEIIVYQEPKLLPQFIDDVIAFQNDHSSLIRKFVVGFIEECWYFQKPLDIDYNVIFIRY